MVGPALVVFLAGLAGLIDEILWARALSFRLGTTTFAAALVVSALILGWGLGALWAGRLRARPSAILLGSQATAGLFSLALPALTLAWGAGGAGVARDAALLLVVLAGGVPMGMAIPTLLALASGAPDSPRRLGGLNGWNGLGALLGALLSGFVLMRWWGLYGTAGCAAGAHLGAALGGWWLARGRALSTPRDAEDPASDSYPSLLGPWLAFLCGFAVLAAQLLATRWLMLYFLGFSYVFSAITGLALVAFGLGSFALPARTRDERRQAGRCLLLLLLAGAGLALAPVLLGILPGAPPSSKAALLQHLSVMWHAAALVFLPICALAGLLPMAYARLRGSSRARGAKALFFNGLGAAAAPWVCALLAIPALGSLRTWVLIAVLVMATAVAVAWGSLRARAGGALARFANGAALLVSAGVALAGLALVAWPGALGSDRLYRLSPVMRSHPEFQLLHASEDASFAIAVVDDGRRAERTLFTDNFRAAGTGDDYVYMRYLGTLPLHLEPRPERVLVIAFGTGTTAGTVAESRQVRELDIVEISPAVIAVRDAFSGVNGAVDEPREGRTVRWHATDGRRFLEASTRRFEAISLEPLLPYAPAAVHLYTCEFYALVRARLEIGGTLTHWIPATGVSAPEVAALVRTFAEGFEHAGLWLFGPSLVLVGSDRPLRFAAPSAEERPIVLAEALAWITDREGMLRLPSGALLCDANPWIEFLGTRSAAERLLYFHDNLAALLAIYSPSTEALLAQFPSVELEWPQRRAVQRRLLEARLREERERLARHARAGRITAPFELEGPDAIELYEAVRRADPGSPVVTAELQRVLYERYLEEFVSAARATLGRGIVGWAELRPQLARLRELARRASRLRPYRFEAWLYLGAAEYLLAVDPDLPPEQVPRHLALALRPWLRAAAIYPRCFDDAEARAIVLPLLGAVDGGGELGSRNLMRVAAERGQRVAQAVPVCSLNALHALLERSQGAERFGDDWLLAFRSVQVERALWRKLAREHRGELPAAYREELFGPE